MTNVNDDGTLKEDGVEEAAGEDQEVAPEAPVDSTDLDATTEPAEATVSTETTESSDTTETGEANTEATATDATTDQGDVQGAAE